MTNPNDQRRTGGFDAFAAKEREQRVAREAETRPLTGAVPGPALVEDATRAGAGAPKAPADRAPADRANKTTTRPPDANGGGRKGI